MRKVHINYVTFARDREWLNYSLLSIKRHASGFSGITIVVPMGDVGLFLPLEKQFSTPECPVLIKNFIEYPGRGFVNHLAMKCYADVFSPSATHILHMDPDCLFCDTVTPDDYFVDGKPVLVVEPYDAIKQHGHHGRFNWKEVTEMALRFPCPYETMCRHPAVHVKEVYKGVRERIEEVHLTPFHDFVIKQKNSFPQGFGEFNTIGSFAMSRIPEKYHFVDRGFDGEKNDPKPKVVQLWSYTGVGRPDNMAAIQKALA